MFTIWYQVFQALRIKLLQLILVLELIALMFSCVILLRGLFTFDAIYQFNFCICVTVQINCLGISHVTHFLIIAEFHG